MSNPSTSPWTAWPDGSDDEAVEWLLNVCPKISGGQAVVRTTGSKEEYLGNKTNVTDLLSPQLQAPLKSSQ